MTYISPLVSRQSTDTADRPGVNAKVAEEWACVLASVQSGGSPTGRSQTYSNLGEIFGRAMGIDDGLAVGGVAGGVTGGAVGAAAGGAVGFVSAGPGGAAAGATAGLWVGGAGGAVGGGILGAYAMERRGAIEGQQVARDFGNATWDVTHSGPISDTVASVAGATWGFLSAPFAVHDYDPSQGIAVKGIRFGVKVAKALWTTFF
jgi:hypothetical protein